MRGTMDHLFNSCIYEYQYAVVSISSSFYVFITRRRFLEAESPGFLLLIVFMIVTRENSKECIDS